MKRFRLLIITTLMTLSTSLTAFAGSWEEDANGWWYKNDDGSYPRSTWFTYPTTGKQYYFNENGYLLIDTTTPDGYKVGSDGAYLESDPDNLAKSKTTKSASYVNAGPGVVGANKSSPQTKTTSTANNTNNNSNSNSNTNSNTNSNSNSNRNSNSNSNSNSNTSTASNNKTNSSSSGSAMISSSEPEPDTTTVLKSPS